MYEVFSQFVFLCYMHIYTFAKVNSLMELWGDAEYSILRRMRCIIRLPQKGIEVGMGGVLCSVRALYPTM